MIVRWSGVKSPGGRGRPRKTISETIKEVIEINEFGTNIIFDRSRTLWRRLINVVNLT